MSNVASRLFDEAKPGQILISPRVLMAVEDAVTVEPVGEFALKGIRRPLAAYNVLGPSLSGCRRRVPAKPHLLDYFFFGPRGRGEARGMQTRARLRRPVRLTVDRKG